MRYAHLKTFQVNGNWQVKQELITGEWFVVADNFKNEEEAAIWLDFAIKIAAKKERSKPIHQKEAMTSLSKEAWNKCLQAVIDLAIKHEGSFCDCPASCDDGCAGNCISEIQDEIKELMQ